MTAETKPTKPEVTEQQILELGNAGVIYGHKKSKTHPKMKPYIGANRNEIELLKPEQIFSKLGKGIEFLKEIRLKGGEVLIVGTQAAAHEAVDKFVEALGYPHVKTRWLGGTLTNWTVIKDRIKHYIELEEKKEKGELEKYTKKERVEFSKELGKLKEKFEGLRTMKKLPEALFVIDPKLHETAMREAKRTNIPVVAIADTNDNPKEITAPIIANDHAKASIDWVVERIIEGLRDAKVLEVKPEEKKKE